MGWRQEPHIRQCMVSMVLQINKLKYIVCECVKCVKYAPLYAATTIGHRSYVIRHTSYIIRHTSYGVRHTSYVISHGSYVIRHTSYVIRHMPYVIRHKSYTIHQNPAKRSCCASVRASSTSYSAHSSIHPKRRSKHAFTGGEVPASTESQSTSSKNACACTALPHMG
jgi:predicted nucleic-acid-binding Zn-ribbon protein